MNTSALTSFGLSEKASKIYLSTLTLGTTSVQDIARHSGLKRPTVYLHIDELLVKQMIEKVPVNKKTYYRAVAPDRLSKAFAKNLEQFNALVPELIALDTLSSGRPSVRLIEGVEGIRGLYAEMETANSLRGWSNIGTVNPQFHGSYMRLMKSVREQGIGAREILGDNKETKKYFRVCSQLAGPTYQARVATEEGLANDTIIFGNVVAIFRLHELNLFAVRIEDKTIADSMRAVFDMAWKSARTIKSRTIQ